MEFPGASVQATVRTMVPRETDYLRRYDQAKARIQAFLEMPDHRFDLMLGFLRRKRGRFSTRARDREFAALINDEVSAIDTMYADLGLAEF